MCEVHFCCGLVWNRVERLNGTGRSRTGACFSAPIKSKYSSLSNNIHQLQCNYKPTIHCLCLEKECNQWKQHTTQEKTNRRTTQSEECRKHQISSMIKINFMSRMHCTGICSTEKSTKEQNEIPVYCINRQLTEPTVTYLVQ